MKKLKFDFLKSYLIVSLIIITVSIIPIICLQIRYKVDFTSIRNIAEMFKREYVLNYYGLVLSIIASLMVGAVTIFVTIMNSKLNKENSLYNRRLEKFPNLQLNREKKNKKGKVILEIQNNSDNTAYKVKYKNKIFFKKILPSERCDFIQKASINELPESIKLIYNDSIDSNIQVTYILSSGNEYIALEPKYVNKTPKKE